MDSQLSRKNKCEIDPLSSFHKSKTDSHTGRQPRNLWHTNPRINITNGKHFRMNDDKNAAYGSSPDLAVRKETFFEGLSTLCINDVVKQLKFSTSSGECALLVR